jgi:hypothetical protein
MFSSHFDVARGRAAASNEDAHAWYENRFTFAAIFLALAEEDKDATTGRS